MSSITKILLNGQQYKLDTVGEAIDHYFSYEPDALDEYIIYDKLERMHINTNVPIEEALQLISSKK